MKKILFVLPFLMLAFLWACDDDAEIVRMENPDPNATITSVSPQRGLVGTVVTIAGTNFGAASQLVQVYFTGVEESVPLLSCEDKELQVAVPEGAQTGPLTIVVMDQKIVTDLEFAVTPDPEMASVSVQQGYASDEIVITGSNFGTTVEDVRLYSVIDGEEIEFEILSCTDTEIKAKVPAVSEFGQFDLNLSVLGRSAVNKLSFTYLEQAAITSVTVENPLIGEFVFAGDNVIVKGTGFGTVVDEVEVTMGGLAATVVSCTNEEIKAQVPDGFTGGAVTVTRNNRQAVSEKELQVLAPNTDITSSVLKNYKQPFSAKDLTAEQSVEGNNSWAEPTDWIVSDVVKNMYNGTPGNYSEAKTGGLNLTPDGNNYLAMQAGWSNNDDGATKSVNNGKMYQSFSLPKGLYQINVQLSEVVHKNGCSMNLVVCKDEELCDYSDLSTAVGYTSFTSVGTLTLDFEIDETSIISVGFIANLVNTSCFKLSSITIKYIDDLN